MFSPVIPAGAATQAVLFNRPMLRVNAVNSNGKFYSSAVVARAIANYTELPIYATPDDSTPGNIVGQVKNPHVVNGTLVVDVYTTSATLLDQLRSGSMSVVPSLVGTLNGTVVTQYAWNKFYPQAPS